MKTLKLLTLIITTTFIIATTQHIYAANQAEPSSTSSNNVMTNGEVRKVDQSANKITLKHGEIKNLDMPPMTMVFRVSDPAMLKHLKQGDKVKFTAEKKEGALTITTIQVIN